MTWIQEIEKIFKEYFKDAFEKLGLERYEEMDGPGMGALIKFKNDNFRIQLINDRGLIGTELSPLNGDEAFRDIELFYALITLTAHPITKELEKKRILGKRLNFPTQAIFVLNNFDQIKMLLNKSNYKDTINQIDNLGRERFDQIMKK